MRQPGHTEKNSLEMMLLQMYASANAMRSFGPKNAAGEGASKFASCVRTRRGAFSNLVTPITAPKTKLIVEPIKPVFHKTVTLETPTAKSEVVRCRTRYVWLVRWTASTPAGLSPRFPAEELLRSKATATIP
jgi:hypothetical protein